MNPSRSAMVFRYLRTWKKRIFWKLETRRSIFLSNGARRTRDKIFLEITAWIIIIESPNTANELMFSLKDYFRPFHRASASALLLDS